MLPACRPRTGHRCTPTRHLPRSDASIVARLRAAGAIVVGKTNTPAFGWTAFTDNQVFGATRNPWNRDRSPGGSSGGSAAALAAGLAPLATTTDGGGSVRIPAIDVRPRRLQADDRSHRTRSGATVDRLLDLGRDDTRRSLTSCSRCRCSPGRPDPTSTSCRRTQSHSSRRDRARVVACRTLPRRRRSGGRGRVRRDARRHRRRPRPAGHRRPAGLRPRRRSRSSGSRSVRPSSRSRWPWCEDRWDEFEPGLAEVHSASARP